jgi:hypothetical protein
MVIEVNGKKGKRDRQWKIREWRAGGKISNRVRVPKWKGRTL